jgi:hypothetical protein
MEVVPRTAIFDYFTSRIYKRDEQPADVEPLLWYLQSAFYSDLTFSIYRLFDKKSGTFSTSWNKPGRIACPSNGRVH